MMQEFKTGLNKTHTQKKAADVKDIEICFVFPSSQTERKNPFN